MVTNASLSIINMLYNFQLMKYIGQNGVTAYGIIMYVGFIFVGVYMGYSVGSAPIIGYNYGAKNNEELKGLLKKFQIIMILLLPSIFGINGIWISVVVAELLSLIVSIFYLVKKRKIYNYA